MENTAIPKRIETNTVGTMIALIYRQKEFLGYNTEREDLKVPGNLPK